MAEYQPAPTGIPGTSTADASIAPQPPSPAAHHHHQNHHPNYPHSSPDNGDLPSPASADAAAAAAAAAVAAAHQGLRALQIAPAVSPTPSAESSTSQQYPPSLHGAHDDPRYVSSHGTPLVSPRPQSKATRLRRACDMCSLRKVKCDESGPPCRQCRELKVECTFVREVKRRGPPNKHVAAVRAAKQPKLGPSLAPAPSSAADVQMSMVAEPTPPPAATDAGSSSAELIAPWPVLQLLVDDFFTYMHPLTPFPHEPTFRHSFENREDRKSPEFLALLASMIGFLVASFPRTVRLHLKRQHSSNLFPRAVAMVDRCRHVALEARGPFFANKEPTVYDAATSYFLGIAAGYTLQWKVCRRFLTETISLLRDLGYNKPTDSSSYHITYRGPGFDHVKDQVGKRIFWVIFTGIRSLGQLGAQDEVAFPPPTPTNPYPELPAEVDDQYIVPQQILGQPEGTVSLLTGFNQGIKIYMTMNGLVSVELSYGITSLPWLDQKAMLNDCLQAVKQVMDGLPRELTLDMSRSTSESSSFAAPPDPFGDIPGYQYQPPAFPAAQPPDDIRRIIESQPQRRRMLQYEVQKANIYTSQLATRSYYVERYLNLRDAHREHSRSQAAYATDGGFGSKAAVAAAAVQAAAEQSDHVDAAMSADRELIVQNLVTMLASIPQRYLEPNGASVINKIRQVASTLVNSPPERKGPMATKADEYLNGFVSILMRLEGTGPGAAGGAIPGGDAMSIEDEEQELRDWTDLREYQERFIGSGGFLGT